MKRYEEDNDEALCADGKGRGGYAQGLASGLLLLLGLAVLTFSVKNALLVFALAFLVSPLGLPMMAVGMLSLLNKLICFLTFA